MKQVERYFLELKLPVENKVVFNKPKNLKITLDVDDDFKINKFFYKIIGKDHYWKDRLIWTDKQWINYVKNPNFMVNIDEDPEKIINQVVESPYTRIPVWKDNNENIIGLIHAKNLLRKLNELKSVKISREDIKKSLIKTWFVPETTPLKNQLQMHLNRKIKLAMVVDEYGVLNGMISLEDIIEEIVGEISDEHDIDLTDIVRNKDGSIKVQGSTEIRNINRSFGWDLPDEDANTISGLIINESRSFPKVGQVFQFYGFKFEIIETKRNLISQVKIASLN